MSTTEDATCQHLVNSGQARRHSKSAWREHRPCRERVGEGDSLTLHLRESPERRCSTVNQRDYFGLEPLNGVGLQGPNLLICQAVQLTNHAIEESVEGLSPSP